MLRRRSVTTESRRRLRGRSIPRPGLTAPRPSGSTGSRPATRPVGRVPATPFTPTFNRSFGWSDSGGGAAARGEGPLEELKGHLAVPLLLVDLGHGTQRCYDVPVVDWRLLDGQLVDLQSARHVALLPKDVRDCRVRAGGILRCGGIEARHDAEQELDCLVTFAEGGKGASSLDREHCGARRFPGCDDDRFAFLYELEGGLGVATVVLDEGKQQQSPGCGECLFARLER